MFYLVHLDHHGGHQGVFEAFSKLENAKKYLDNRPQEFRRCGMVAVHTDTGFFARVIVEIPLRIRKGENTEYYILEPSVDEKNAVEKRKKFDIWNNALNKALDIVEKHADFLSDWRD